MSIFDSVKKLKKNIKDKYKTAKDAKKDKPKGGSQYIEPTDAQIETLANLVAEGLIDPDQLRIRPEMRDADGKKLSKKQTQDALLIIYNWVTYDSDPEKYVISEDGRTLSLAPVEETTEEPAKNLRSN